MSDRILFSIGEALIDMIPSRVGCSFDEVPPSAPGWVVPGPMSARRSPGWAAQRRC